MRYVAILAAVGMVSASLGREDLFIPSEIQDKVDMGWAKEAIDGAVEATKKAVNATHDVGSALGDLESKAANATSQLTNASSGILGGVAKQGKAIGFTAALAYLGTCKEYFALLSDIRKAAVPKLAEAFQQQKRDPSASAIDCNAAVQDGLESTVDTYMKDRKQEEQVAVKWITADRAHVLCGDKLMKALDLYSGIREKFPKQYTQAMSDRLLLEIVTEKVVGDEIDRICGHSGGFQAGVQAGAARLFAEAEVDTSARREPGASSERRAVVAVAVLAGASMVVGLVARSRAVGRRAPRLWEQSEQEEALEDAGEAIE